MDFMKHENVCICIVPLTFSFLSVLVWFLFLWQILWPKAMLGRKGFIWLMYTLCHGLTVDWRKPRQELKQGLWRSTACWLLPHVLLTLPFYTTQEPMPKSCCTSTGLASLTSVINQEHIPHRLDYCTTLWRHFLRLGFLFLITLAFIKE